MAEQQETPAPVLVTVYEREPRVVVYDHTGTPWVRVVGFPRPVPKGR